MPRIACAHAPCQKTGKATEGVVCSPLSGVNPRLRCASIAARGIPCQQTARHVSAIQPNQNLL